MSGKKDMDRFTQKAEGVEITNVPPKVLAFIKKQQEQKRKAAEDNKE